MPSGVQLSLLVFPLISLDLERVHVLLQRSILCLSYRAAVSGRVDVEMRGVKSASCKISRLL